MFFDVSVIKSRLIRRVKPHAGRVNETRTFLDEPGFGGAPFEALDMAVDEQIIRRTYVAFGVDLIVEHGRQRFDGVLLAGGGRQVEMIARRVISPRFAHHECLGRARHVSDLRKIRAGIRCAGWEQIIVQRETKWPLLIRIARATPQVRSAQIRLQRGDP